MAANENPQQCTGFYSLRKDEEMSFYGDYLLLINIVSTLKISICCILTILKIRIYSVVTILNIFPYLVQLLIQQHLARNKGEFPISWLHLPRVTHITVLTPWVYYVTDF